MKKHMKAIFLILALALASAAPLRAQVAVKTNLLYDAALSPNLGAEIGLAPKWSFEVSGNFNGWTLSNDRRWKHWLVQPEVRYWLCDRFSGHFFGAHALGGQFNVGGLKHRWPILDTTYDLRTHRYQGWYYGLGLAYGYTWILAKHWSCEAEIGLGWIHARYDVYPCRKCGTPTDIGRTRDYFGLTKAALNLIYVF